MDKRSSLRKKLLKAAIAHPEQREKLLFIIAKLVGKEAAETFKDFIKGKTFLNPDTRNKVQFDSLPDAEQKKIREHWEEGKDGEGDDTNATESEELPDYNLKIVGNNKKRAVYVAKKMKEGIEKSADICKLSPPVCEGNLGLSRDNMPQILTKPLPWLMKNGDAKEKKLAQAAIDAGADPDSEEPPVVQFINALEKEGVKVDRKATMQVGGLHATQKEIQAAKTFKFADSYYKGKFDLGHTENPNDRILVSSDGHILDGHHRWAALLVADPKAEIEITKVDLPIKELLRRSFQQPGVFRANLDGDPVPEDKDVDLGDGPEKIERKKVKKTAAPSDDPRNDKGKKASLRLNVLKLALANPKLQPHLYRILKTHG